MRQGEPTILIIDDEAETRKFVGMNLKARGYNILTAQDGTEGIKLFEDNFVNLVLLDVSMPGPDGFQVCRHLRRSSNVPIIILSARGREQDKVTALDLGADDYLTKPFGVEELLARVRATLRRTHGAQGSAASSYRFGDVEVDLGARLVLRRGAAVKFTPIEFSLLGLLIRNAGRVLTYRAILEAVWGGEYLEEREYVWAYIRRLRAKLEASPDAPLFILNEPGVGYRFALEQLKAPTEAAPDEM